MRDFHAFMKKYFNILPTLNENNTKKNKETLHLSGEQGEAGILWRMMVKVLGE